MTNKWKIAKVTPIHKKENNTDCNNYRPISLLNTCSEILERAVHKQLIDHLETNYLGSKTQFGYGKNRSTELATILLSDNIRKAVDGGYLVGVLYVNLSKAFDTISYSALLEKLKIFGITGDSHNWFTDLLKQFCVVENCGSTPLKITCGVPQGWILGRLLFLIFANGFEKCLKRSQFLNFADDTVVKIWKACQHTSKQINW